MAATRGELVSATIYEVDKNDVPVGDPPIQCMFNPYEYTLSKSNNYTADPKNRRDMPELNFQKAGAITLKLNLLFDTYESGEDVSRITNKLWKFMQPQVPKDGQDYYEPPRVAFHWGIFRFAAVITNMTQKFTLFLYNGTPVRAKVDITFSQDQPSNIYPKQNPTSGAEQVLRTWPVIRGDRLDLIASAVYGDATRWRQIADYNNLDDPLTLRPGQRLIIPEDHTTI